MLALVHLTIVKVLKILKPGAFKEPKMELWVSEVDKESGFGAL